jgi:hypothetical protein
LHGVFSERQAVVAVVASPICTIFIFVNVREKELKVVVHEPHGVTEVEVGSPVVPVEIPTVVEILALINPFFFDIPRIVIIGLPIIVFLGGFLPELFKDGGVESIPDGLPVVPGDGCT